MNKVFMSDKSLKYLSDESLDQSLLSFIKKEKEALKEILRHVAEIDRRRLFLRLGYSSLYSYLTERMGYDGGSAQRRIDAARLAQQVPSVIESIDQGEITLAQITFLQKSFRQAKEQKISTEAKATMVEAIKYKTLAETQVAVCKRLNIEVKESPKISCQANESVRLEVTLSKEQWEKMKTMRELLSSALPSGEWDQVLEYVAVRVIEQRTKASRSQGSKGSAEKAVKGQRKGAVPVKTQDETNKNICESLKRQVLLRDGCCQYKDQKSGKICGSQWNLQADHIQPRWAGGGNELENLRVLCANHNREVYRQQAGIRRI
ncbi:MAG: HNH endonuclease [Bdellovibrionales bacterium]|nr:HNH endonuclease [Bdellovibrionales bacterium]